MKRHLISLLILIPAFLITSALASGFGGLFAETEELPDPSEILLVDPVFYGDDLVVEGISYCAYAYPMPDDQNAFLCDYSVLANNAGYTVSSALIEAFENFDIIPAWQVSSGALNAYIITDFRGCMLFLVNPMLNYPLLPTPKPTPAPTPAPTHAPTPRPTSSPAEAIPNSSNGHWEYIEVKQDCFACFGGTCDLCNGSGIYRAYGSEVPCSRFCETCDGLGYWYTTQSVWVQ